MSLSLFCSLGLTVFFPFKSFSLVSSLSQASHSPSLSLSLSFCDSSSSIPPSSLTLFCLSDTHSARAPPGGLGVCVCVCVCVCVLLVCVFGVGGGGASVL